MAKSLSSIVIATDTFSSWITKTNQLISALGTEIITANTSVDGANTTGNTNLIGIFSANTVAVGNSLRGGTVNAAANLTITSNAVFAGANAGFTANISVTNAVTAINATSMVVTGPTLTIGSNTTLSGNVSITGRTLTVASNAAFTGTNTDISSLNTNLAGNNVMVSSNTFTVNAVAATYASPVTFNGTVAISNTAALNANVAFGGYAKHAGVSNTDIGANTGSAIAMFNWIKSEYRGGDLTCRVGNTTSTRMSKVLVATNGTDTYMTEYAVLKAPTTANLGTFSVTSNTTHAVLNFTPNVPNLSMSLDIQLTV